MSESAPTIDELFKLAAEGLKSEFEKIRKEVQHYPTSGQEGEELLIKFLNNHLPRRFFATSGFVIDSENKVSKQSDVLIYDAENSAVYRAGKNQILPADSVAAVIEVKAKLNKSELEDAAKKVASVKSLKRTPVTNIDQPVTFSNLIINASLGVVFAFDSETSLRTLADNLKAINKGLPRAHWIDVIVVLGKGMISYCMKFPGEDRTGLIMPEASEDFIIPPCYIHLSVFEDAPYALNSFFISLMSVLAFFRKRTTISLNDLLKGSDHLPTNICNYWYDTNRQLVEVPKSQEGKGKDPLFGFDVFHKCGNQIIARYKVFEWADGFVYEIIPHSPEALQILRKIVNIKSKEKFTVVPTQGGAVAISTLLKEKPAVLSEIIDLIPKYFPVRIEVRK
jgi:hypothetical protein